MSNYLFESSDNELSDENAKDTAIKRNISTESFTQEAIAEKLHFLRSFRHDNFVSVIEAFHYEDSSTIEAVVEFMPVAVDELCVRAFPFHDQFSLAAILGQVSKRLFFTQTITAANLTRFFKGSLFLRMPDSHTWSLLSRW